LARVMSGRSREEERREDGKNEEASADGTKQGELLTPLFVSALCEHARTRTPHSQRKCTSIHSSVYLPATCCEPFCLALVSHAAFFRFRRRPVDRLASVTAPARSLAHTPAHTRNHAQLRRQGEAAGSMIEKGNASPT